MHLGIVRVTSFIAQPSLPFQMYRTDAVCISYYDLGYTFLVHRSTKFVSCKYIAYFVCVCTLSWMALQD